MLIKRLFCLVGAHTWGRWTDVKTSAGSVIYRQRQCVVCGRTDIGIPAAAVETIKQGGE